MRFATVCSGIEAASAAFGPLGWEAAWFSEIEPFPCAVLAHHYPSVPNLGDMTTIRARIEAGEVEAPDSLWGGTPCQSFSVAGLRRSLDDERGNLSLEFIRIADAIDRVRRAAGKPAAWIGWENVPGVLSTRDNAFGAFLGGLCGSDSAIPTPDGGWPNAGVVAGPSRVVAWRVLDAQFFGVAQRRKRVVVLALGGPGAWACADALLPISDRMRWHPAPRREAGKGAAAGTLRSSDGGSDVDHARAEHLITGTLQANGKAAGSATQQDAESGLLVAYGGNNTSGPIDVSAGLNAKGGAGRMDFDSETFVTQPIPFDSTQITHPENRSNPQPGDPVGTLAKGGHAPAIAFAATDYESGAFERVEQAAPLATSADRARAAPILAFSAKDHGADAVEGIAPTMRAGGHAASHANAGVMPAIQHGMQVRRLTPRECERLQGFEDDFTLIPFGRPSAKKLDADFLKYQLRGNPKHLTRADIERLAADGPRYKALGNSWAVPKFRWLGQRIQAVRGGA